MTEILILRLTHVVGGIFWVGAGLFVTLFLTPALRELGPSAGQVMTALQRRRLFLVLPVVALLTIFSGLRLLWIVSGGFAAGYFATPRGAAFGASGAAAIVAFLLSLLVTRPAAVAAAQLRQGIAAADASARAGLLARADRLQRRSAVWGSVAMGLLIISAAGMSIARYVN